MDVANLGNGDGFLSSLQQCGDWLFSSILSKMYKRDIKHTLDVTFLDYLTLTFCDVICDLLPERIVSPSRVEHFA